MTCRIRAGVLMVAVGLSAAPVGGQSPPDPARPREIRSEVEGRAMVIFAVKPGSAVARGQLLCELDSAPLRDRLIDREIAVKKAEAAVETAGQFRTMAELNQKTVEVESGARLWKAELDRRVAENGMTLAVANLRAAEEAGASARVRRDFEIAKMKAENSLEDARHRLSVLTEFSLPRRALEAEVRIKKTQAAELRQTAERELAKARVASLEGQIAACRILAPVDGTVEPPRPEGEAQGQPPIREGDWVRGKQALFLLRPTSPPEGRSPEAPKPQASTPRPEGRLRP